jgi:hypothetical protein
MKLVFVNPLLESNIDHVFAVANLVRDNLLNNKHIQPLSSYAVTIEEIAALPMFKRERMTVEEISAILTDLIEMSNAIGGVYGEDKFEAIQNYIAIPTSGNGRIVEGFITEEDTYLPTTEEFPSQKISHLIHVVNYAVTLQDNRGRQENDMDIDLSEKDILAREEIFIKHNSSMKKMYYVLENLNNTIQYEGQPDVSYDSAEKFNEAIIAAKQNMSRR